MTLFSLCSLAFFFARLLASSCHLAIESIQDNSFRVHIQILVLYILLWICDNYPPKYWVDLRSTQEWTSMITLELGTQVNSRDPSWADNFLNWKTQNCAVVKVVQPKTQVLNGLYLVMFLFRGQWYLSTKALSYY